MANSLLDFVMSLVRDPDAAARYAADPGAALADANLSGVTSADVNSLIPMVTDSVTSMVGGQPTGDGNVWTSGAAAAAFDAFDSFDAHIPEQVVHLADPVFADPTHALADVGHVNVDSAAGLIDPGIVQAAPQLDELPGYEQVDPLLPDWIDDPVDHHSAQDHPGFDLF
jgi:hypothetical protein